MAPPWLEQRRPRPAKEEKKDLPETPEKIGFAVRELNVNDHSRDM